MNPAGYPADLHGQMAPAAALYSEVPPVPHHQAPPQHAAQLEQYPGEVANNGASAESGAHQQQSLRPISNTETSTGRTYSLDVRQQPQRARMCGFGDKDRRPITPPPCVRLVIIDSKTGKEVDCNEIDHSLYVLSVDLWSEDGNSEVNLVRHSSGTPSISSTTPAAYASLPDAAVGLSPHVLGLGRDASYAASGMQYGVPPYGMGPQSGYGQAYMSPNGYGNQYGYEYRDMPPNVAPLPSQAGMAPYGRGMYQDMNTGRMIGGPTGQPQGMFTRNLIGSLAASAFRLTDTNEKIGIWFVLQDLSIRTEGNFRLRFSFVNVGPPPGSANGINTGRAPVLASCFSDVFTVYSAKKFPGVCESTALSKCFATQGIKIPIRKEGATSKDDDDDY